MGIKEKIKNGEISKGEAIKIVNKWKTKDPFNIKNLNRLTNWIVNRK